MYYKVFLRNEENSVALSSAKVILLGISVGKFGVRVGKMGVQVGIVEIG